VTSQLWWYLARAAGIVSWALVAISVCWGLLLAGRPIPGRAVGWARPHRLLDLHRYLGALAVVFTGIHVGALIADSYVHFDVVDVLVPFASSWRPGAVAWGVVAVWLLAAVELTSLAKRRLPPRVWHGVHLASYPLFAMATVHGLTAGTDATNPVLRLAMVAAASAVVGLTVYRVGQLSRPRATKAERPPAGRTPDQVPAVAETATRGT
jgi:predicted ferric reductase